MLPAFVPARSIACSIVSLVRTPKENLLWIRPFATVAELIDALREFRRRYNEQWLIRRHGYRTPSRVRSELVDGSQAVA